MNRYLQQSVRMASRYLAMARPSFAARAFSSQFDQVPMGPPDAILGIMEVGLFSTDNCHRFT